MLLNYCIGITGFVLAGDAIGRGLRECSGKYISFGVIEFFAGLYFSIAAIGI